MANRDVIWLVEFWLFKMTCGGVRCTTVTGNQSVWKLTIKENVQQTLVCRTLLKRIYRKVGAVIRYRTFSWSRMQGLSSLGLLLLYCSDPEVHLFEINHHR